MDGMTEHSDLIERASAWAARKRLPLDADLLEEILRLREGHDELAAGDWPAGSVEHLLLVRWPGHGSAEPDPDEMAETLDTYWRFLRGNGLMSFGSAPPKRLLLEWRRAVPRMGEQYADPQAQGIGRQLVGFGEEIGVDLQEAESMEELQARLDQVTEAWNALPQEERLRRSPRGSGPMTFGAEEPWSDEPWDEDPDEDLDDADEDVKIFMSDPADSVQDVRRSGFVARCLALADWVGEGKEITASKVLRPAVARAAYRELDLALHNFWVRMHGRARQDQLRADRAELEKVTEDILTSLRSALDLPELHDLWTGCVQTELIELRGKRAVGVPQRPTSDQEWVALALALATSLFVSMSEERFLTVLHALLPQAMPGDQGWDRTELRESWWESQANDWGRGSSHPSREWSDWGMDGVIELLADLGVWRVGSEALGQDGEALGPTAFGHDVALMTVALLDTGALGPDEEGGAHDHDDPLWPTPEERRR